MCLRISWVSPGWTLLSLPDLPHPPFVLFWRHLHQTPQIHHHHHPASHLPFLPPHLHHLLSLRPSCVTRWTFFGFYSGFRGKDSWNKLQLKRLSWLGTPCLPSWPPALFGCTRTATALIGWSARMLLMKFKMNESREAEITPMDGQFSQM